jgi:hypothetical protein
MHLRFRFFLISVTLAPRLLAAQSSRCANSTITGDRVGMIHIGMPIDSVGERCRILRDTTEMDEGESVRIVYALVGRDTLRFAVLRDSVWMITVRRPGFTTRDSIRVGTPLSRFLRVEQHPTILVGEGKVFLLDRDHCGNSFGLSAQAYRRLPRTVAALARLPRSTVIDEIIVRGTSTRLPNVPCD